MDYGAVFVLLCARLWRHVLSTRIAFALLSSSLCLSAIADGFALHAFIRVCFLARTLLSAVLPSPIHPHIYYSI